MMLTNLLSSMFITNSFILMTTNSPIGMLVTLIIQTMVVCTMTKYILQTSWILFILFLVFVGGLLVLFIYTISLTPNYQFSTHSYLLIMSISTFLATGLFTVILDNKLQEMMKSESYINSLMSMKLYFNSSIKGTTMMMTYLLLVLLVIVEIALTKKSSMRSSVYFPKTN